MEKEDIVRAETFYKAGDYRRAREIAKQIEAAEQADEALKERARYILTATGSDPMVAVAFFVTGALIVFLIVWYIL